MAEDDVTQAGFSIRGRVQGVGFRWWTRQTAEEMGLSGSVKNLPDGSVEVHVRGPASSVRRFRERLERGPSAARVEEVVELDGSALPIPDGHFRIAH